MTIVIDTSLEGEIDSWSTLKDYITEETDGKASSSQLGAYIRRAESRIRRALAIRPVAPMQTSTSLTFTGETAVGPSDMVRPYALELTDGVNRQEVSFVERENISAYQLFNDSRVNDYPATDSSGYYPHYFTMNDQTLRFWPAQSRELTGTLYYFQKLPALSEDNQSNWMLRDHPDVYLDGALYYAYRAMPDIEKASLMKDIFEQALSEALEAYQDPANRAPLALDPGIAMTRYHWPYVPAY